MRLPLYCDWCLQGCTDGNGNNPADYFEDGEMCPYCQNGHLNAVWPDEKDYWLGKFIDNMPEERRQRLRDNYSDKVTMSGPPLRIIEEWKHLLALLGPSSTMESNDASQPPTSL